MFQELIKRYAEELVLKEEVVARALESLRIHALSKLAEKSKFQATGIATVKVKVAAGQASYFVPTLLSITCSAPPLVLIVPV